MGYRIVLTQVLFFRNLQRDIDRMTSERQQLVYVQEQLSSERDQALKQCESLMKTSATVSTEQTELATQKIELLQERDQARAELRDTTILLEQVSQCLSSDKPKDTNSHLVFSLNLGHNCLIFEIWTSLTF